MFEPIIGLRTVGGFVAGVVITVLLGNLYWGLKLDRCELNHERTLRQISRSTAEQLARAAEAADKTIVELELKRRESDAKAEELRREIRRLRTIHIDREHRVLINEAIAPSNPVPQTPVQSVDRPPEPSPATSEPRATDNLAEWAVTAATMYRDCQAQIQALREWTDRTFSPEQIHDQSSRHPREESGGGEQ